MRDFDSRLVQSIDFTEVIIPQVKSKVKIGGVNVQDVGKINKRILQNVERLRSVEENTAQKISVLSNTYFKIWFTFKNLIQYFYLLKRL